MREVSKDNKKYENRELIIVLGDWKSNAMLYLEGNTPAGGPGTRSLPDPMGTGGNTLLIKAKQNKKLN